MTALPSSEVTTDVPQNVSAAPKMQFLADLPAEIGADIAFDIVQSGQAPLIDIRSPMEWFQSGVPEGATLISIHEPGFIEKLDAVLDGDKSKPFVLICRTGNRSPHIFQALTQHGYTNMFEVPEGMFGSYRSPHPGWVTRGLPVTPHNPYIMD